MFVFFFKQKTAYEMRISDWSSDVCSSDLIVDHYHAVVLTMSYAFDNIIGANGVRRIDHQSVSGVVHVEAEALKTLGDARFGFLQAEEEAAVNRSRRFYGQFEAKQGIDVTGGRTEQHEIASYKVSQEFRR